MKLDYLIIELKTKYTTRGVAKLLGKEFVINKNEYSKDDVNLLVNYILNHFLSTKQKIVDGETFGCGSWLILFKHNSDNIELHELKIINNGENVYEFDVSFSVKFLKEQFELIKTHNIPSYNIPLIGQKIAVSKEIFLGSEVNGVRYSAPDHMTGWYLTSNSYNGDINTLKVDYLFSLLKVRPDLAKFLILPYGFRFYSDNESYDIWFDSNLEG